jgi:hypothetical protein
MVSMGASLAVLVICEERTEPTERGAGVDHDAGEKTSWLYVIGVVGATPIKIGVSVDPKERLAYLQTGSPLPLVLLWKIPGSFELEGDLHTFFDPYRLHGEWFEFGSVDPVALVAAATGMHPVLQEQEAEEEEAPHRTADCARCGALFTLPPAGRPPRFCGRTCRQRAYEARKIQRVYDAGLAAREEVVS